MQVAVDRRLGNLVILHQRANKHALLAPLLELSDLLGRELLAAAKYHPSGLGELDAIHLALGPQLRLELSDGPEHVEEQPAGRVVGVDLLVEHLKVDTLAPQLLGDLAEVQRRIVDPGICTVRAAGVR